MNSVNGLQTPSHILIVGEYNEIESVNEDGLQETTFILTGTTRGSWLELEQDKEKIEQLFKDKIAILPNNNGIAIFI